ncbi:MAG: hypothetical protein AB1589_03750 [Cyanobacteriota bacterium]
MTAVMVIGLVGCGDRIKTSQPFNSDRITEPQRMGQLSEVAPPPVIGQLSQSLKAYQPQVTILSPRADEVVQDTTVSVRLQVQDLPVFKDPDLGLGPHLHLILDNQPYRAVYDLDQPIVFEDLPPGTHTLRVFASRPWHESFKNEGAYAQTTFHIFTKTTDNNPDPALPLLTYSRPTGSYGAEPILLDFYLTNAPLHLVAQENPDDDIADWRIRVTVNGESFVLDRWQPVYLKGFKPGKNWVHLEFLDEQGNPVKNVFNDTVRVITYEPKGKDTLSKLVRGELSPDAASGIVGPNYKAQPTPIPSPEVTPAPIPSPTVEPTPIPSVAPSVEETPTSEPVAPEEEPIPEEEAAPTPSEAPVPVEVPTPEAEVMPAPVIEPVPVPTDSEKSRFGNFFKRFRRSAEAPSLSPEQPEELEVPAGEPTTVPAPPEQTSEPEASPTPSESPTIEAPTAEEVSPTPSESPAPVEEPTPDEEAAPTAPATQEKSRFGDFFDRFRRPAEAPSLSPEQPEELEVPAGEPTIVPAPPEPASEPEASPTPSESPTVEAPTLTEEASPTTPPTQENSKAKGFFNRFRRPATAPSPSPTLPGAQEAPSPEPTALPEQSESQVETTPVPETLVIPSEPPASPEEQTPETESVEVEPSPVIEPVPVRPIQPEKSAKGFLKRFQRPSLNEPAPGSGLPPTLPEIVETPVPQSSASDSSTLPSQEVAPTPDSATENSPAASDSQRSTSSPETEGTQTPTPNLEEVLISPPAPNPSPRIIQAPVDAVPDIPSRFLKKSAADVPVEAPPISEVPAENSEATNVPIGKEGSN